MGIILIILGLVAIVFGKVIHITDSTVKAAGWIVLNFIHRITGILLVLAAIARLMGL